ncbi:MAG: type I DNA topoisomerase [Salinivirgaceae bacterium]|nr:type I DNA topoisomerase [Salinivirgaceae bacterium]
MQKNLVIVESPAKAKTIEKFLGKDYTVMSSYGHIRDLAKKGFGIDIEKKFSPNYEISADKKKLVADLKKATKEAEVIWLASDEDREGEAIAWHLYEVLGLKNKETKRIVFHEITKEAILHAIETPRDIDINLVNAQQARRVLDRLVGFELSPVLWKKIRPSLSAGRVQSVAVRLIVDREREIMDYTPEISYKVTGNFTADKNVELKAELNHRFDSSASAKKFLEDCKNASFSVADISQKPVKRSPAPPFTTSTLQQEASRKFGFSVSQTMSIAQKLYEDGKITYMRTDSVNLSDAAVAAASEAITNLYGKEYLKVRQYKTKTKGAQEAHEAIRPTYLSKETISGTASEKRLYELIWKRTVASLMSDAELEKTTIALNISNSKYQFVAQGEMVKFDGFLKVYIESTDEQDDEEAGSLMPKLSIGQLMDYKNILATQKFSLHQPRYTEASLVRKLEELGIGRPSTYAPTISTIQNREYVLKEDRPGKTRVIEEMTLKNGVVNVENKNENYEVEKGKLFPTDIGMVVNDYLVENFPSILDYNFTAEVEKELDDVAEGSMVWQNMIEEFYNPFHQTIETAVETSGRKVGERVLGTDPQSGKQIVVKIGRYGPMAQIGGADEDEKPQFAALRKDQHIETITLEEALDLFKLPRTLGNYEDKTVVAAIGRFGPYIRHNNAFYSLKKGIDDPYTVTLDRAIELIEEKRLADKNKVINVFETDKGQIQVLNGRFGPYVAFDGKNYRIPKTVDVTTLTAEQCKEIIAKEGSKTSTKSSSRTTRKK